MNICHEKIIDPEVDCSGNLIYYTSEVLGDVMMFVRCSHHYNSLSDWYKEHQAKIISPDEYISLGIILE
jgi:hypothetical protein